MVKRIVNMPNEEPNAKSFPIVPIGEHKFQITDVKDTNDIDIVSVMCEVVSEQGNGISLIHRVNLNENNKFFWLTRIFLKCIGEPCKGDNVLIDTDAWIGRQITGRVEHSTDSKYANIKEFIYKDEPQPIKTVQVIGEKIAAEIAWDE